MSSDVEDQHMNANRFSVARSLLVTVVLATVLWVSAGNLDPPGGAISPTMKDLDDVEPRTAIRNPSDPFEGIVIDAPGSYYLAEDIQARHSQHGIRITTPNVTLDLNGFTIFGNPEVLSLDGIRLEPEADRVRIRKGTIQDFGGHGIGTDASGADDLIIEDLIVYNNGGSGTGYGMWLAGSSRVKDCVVTGNVRGGIRAGSASVVSGCITQDNGLSGVFCDSGSVVVNTTGFSNGSTGINSTTGTVVRGCSARFNDAKGIWVSVAGTVSGSNARENGEEGILAPSGLIHGCTSTANTGANFSGGTVIDSHP